MLAENKRKILLTRKSKEAPNALTVFPECAEGMKDIYGMI